MPVVMPTNETMVDGTLYLVMRGRLLPQTMQLALEHFTRQKLSDGLTLRELETQNTLRLTQIEQLEEGVFLRSINNVFAAFKQVRNVFFCMLK